jgi:hypothetical protein
VVGNGSRQVLARDHQTPKPSSHLINQSESQTRLLWTAELHVTVSGGSYAAALGARRVVKGSSISGLQCEAGMPQQALKSWALHVEITVYSSVRIPQQGAQSISRLHTHGPLFKTLSAKLVKAWCSLHPYISPMFHLVGLEQAQPWSCFMATTHYRWPLERHN